MSFIDGITVSKFLSIHFFAHQFASSFFFLSVCVLCTRRQMNRFASALLQSAADDFPNCMQTVTNVLGRRLQCIPQDATLGTNTWDSIMIIGRVCKCSK